MVDGQPMCGQHCNAASLTRSNDGWEVFPLADWDGSCTGAFYCPATVHVEGCYSQPAHSRAELAGQMKAHQERFGT